VGENNLLSLRNEMARFLLENEEALGQIARVWQSDTIVVAELVVKVGLRLQSQRECARVKRLLELNKGKTVAILVDAGRVRVRKLEPVSIESDEE
jgi:hypothetical protein